MVDPDKKNIMNRKGSTSRNAGLSYQQYRDAQVAEQNISFSLGQAYLLKMVLRTAVHVSSIIYLLTGH